MFQSGGECIRAYASVSLDQIVQWRDEQGTCFHWTLLATTNPYR